MVRYVGSQRALDLGALANLMARMEMALRRDGRRITEAQRRLIIRRLEAQDALDTYALSREGQLHLLCESVARYAGLDATVVASYLRAC